MKVGVTVLLLWISGLLASAADYTNFARLFSFSGTNGAQPYANLIEGSDGRLYGTTFQGGITNEDFPNGMGVVFALNKDGSGFEVVHFFGGSSHDGANPYAELVEGRFGVLYGTTRNGGRFDKGTIFKLSKNGTGYYRLHSFGSPGDGAYSEAGLLRVEREQRSLRYGNLKSARSLELIRRGQVAELYGVTLAGGNSKRGAMFKLRETGAGYEVINFGIHIPERSPFGPPPDNSIGPASTPVFGPNGSLYATSLRSMAGLNWGSILCLPRRHLHFNEVFPIEFLPSQSPYIYVDGLFPPPGTNFYSPAGRLLAASDGLLYGTVAFGGGSGNNGAIFRFADAQDMQSEVVLTFNDSDDVGVSPTGGLVEGPDGQLYGTTSNSAAANFLGSIFRINKDGSNLTVLKRFPTSGMDGAHPRANLLFGTDGVIYGTTPSGGDNDYGAIFALYP